MTSHKTGTREEWLTARLELLEAEKEQTRRGDERSRWWPSSQGSVAERRPRFAAGADRVFPGGACRFAGHADQPPISGGAAGMAGFQAELRDGPEPDLQAVYGPGEAVALDLVPYTLRVLRRCPGRGPWPALQRGHEPIGLIRGLRQQVR